MEKVYKDPHIARRMCPVIPTKPFKDDDDIVEYEVVKKVRKVGEGDDDYVLEDVVIESSRVNRQAWIAKDADDVGVLNILNKVRLSGDVSLFNQTHSEISSELQDYTNVPGSISEALEAIKNGSDSFEGLKAIFGNVSFEELAGMSSEQIQAKLNEFLASQKVKEEVEKGEEK